MNGSLDASSLRLLQARVRGGPAPRRLGLMVLATDHTSERDFAQLMPPEAAALHVSRVAFANPTSEANLRRMQPHLTAAADLILPGEPLDALVFSCTSGSMYIGEAAVTAAIQAAKPGVPVITPAAAAIEGLAALGVRRVALLTPYTRAVTAALRDHFQGRGLEIVATACFDMEDDREMAAVEAADIVAAAREIAVPAAEALFVSCTALPAAALAGEIEAAIGRPVVTSNQATLWRALRQLGWTAPLAGLGRLLTLPVPDARKAG